MAWNRQNSTILLFSGRKYNLLLYLVIFRVLIKSIYKCRKWQKNIWNYWNYNQQSKTANDGYENCKQSLDFTHDFQAYHKTKMVIRVLTKISSYLHRASTQNTSDRPTGNACPSPIPGSIQREKNVTDSEVADVCLVDTYHDKVLHNSLV